MRETLTSILIALSLLMIDARPAFCQGASASQSAGAKMSSVQLDEKARKIKRTVEKIGVAGKLTLYLKNGEELYGNVVSYDEEGLQITEIDLKRVVSVQYRNIKRVREGYGNPNLLTGKRTNPPKGVKVGIIVAALFLALGLPVIALAAAKD